MGSYFGLGVGVNFPPISDFDFRPDWGANRTGAAGAAGGGNSGAPVFGSPRWLPFAVPGYPPKSRDKKEISIIPQLVGYCRILMSLMFF